MTTSESEMLILNSKGIWFVSKVAERLLITPVDTTIGLGRTEVDVHLDDVEPKRNLRANKDRIESTDL